MAELENIPDPIPARPKVGQPAKKILNEWGLTPAQDQFAIEYCLDFKVTAAAIRAGYSKKSANDFARDLYANPKIKARIKDILAKRRDEYAVNVERLQTEVARIAFSDITSVITVLDNDEVEITLKGLKALPARIRAAIKSIEQTKFGVKVAFYDKLGALDMLAKHLGYFEKDNEQKKVEAIGLYLPENGREVINEEDLGDLDNPNAATVQ